MKITNHLTATIQKVKTKNKFISDLFSSRISGTSVTYNVGSQCIFLNYTGEVTLYQNFPHYTSYTRS